MADTIGVQVIEIKSHQIKSNHWFEYSFPASRGLSFLPRRERPLLAGKNIPLFFCHFLLFLLTLCFLPATVYQHQLEHLIAVSHLFFLFIQVSDTDDGPKPKKKHAEVAGTSDDKKPADLVTHNSIAETLVCSICQVRWEDSSDS